MVHIPCSEVVFPQVWLAADMNRHLLVLAMKLAFFPDEFLSFSSEPVY